MILDGASVARSTVREAGGWIAAALTAALPLSVALMWVEAQTGQDHGQQTAVMLDLSALPPIAAVAEPPPAPPMTSAPEMTVPEVSDLSLTPPAVETAPDTFRSAPTPDLLAEADALPQMDAPPPVPAQVALPLPTPPARPTAQVEPTPRKAKPVKPPAQQVAPSGNAPSAAAQPAASRKGSATLEAGWGAQIRKKIERRKAYPGGAAGAAGRVTLRITVARDGQLVSVVLAGSSGHPALDQAAVSAVQRAGRLPTAPDGLTEARHVFTLPMDFAP